MFDESSEPWMQDKNSTLTLRELAAPLFRRKATLITTFGLTFGATLLIGLLTPPEYNSHTAILVNRERLNSVVSAEATTPIVSESNPVTEEDMNSEAELLKSRDVLEQVVLANGLENREHSSFFHRNQTRQDRIARAIRSLAKRIKVGEVSKTTLINVDYSSTDPQLAHDVLQSLDTTYMERRIAIYRPAGSLQFFAQQAQMYRDALEQSEARLKQFGEQQGAAAPELERTNLATQVSSSIGQLHQARQAIASDRERLQSDRQQMSGMPQRSPTLRSTAPADRLLENLQATLLAARTKRAELAMKYAPTYPLVREVDQEIADDAAALDHAERVRYVTETTDRDPTYELLREDETRTQADLATQQANLAAIGASIASLQSQMADLGKQAITEQDLERDIKTNETSYLLYLSKREQARTENALDKTRIANVAIAVQPDVPALPEHGVLYYPLIGLGLATVLAIAMAYIIEYFDSRFHTPADVMDALGIPIVVAIPREAV